MPAKTNVPAGAKQPTDHLAKAEAVGGSVTVEHNGVVYVIDEDVFNDVEILELVGDMQDNALLLPKVVRTILGDEQWRAFKDGNRNEKGRVPGEALNDLFAEMDAAVGNSEASPGS